MGSFAPELKCKKSEYGMNGLALLDQKGFKGKLLKELRSAAGTCGADLPGMRFFESHLQIGSPQIPESREKASINQGSPVISVDMTTSSFFLNATSFTVSGTTSSNRTQK